MERVVLFELDQQHLMEMSFLGMLVKPDYFQTIRISPKHSIWKADSSALYEQLNNV